MASGSVGLNGAPGNGPKPVMRIVAVIVRSDPERAGDLVDRDRRRDASFGDRGLDAGKLGYQRRVRSEPREHAVLEHRPHPFDLLLAPPRLDLSGRGHALAVV